MYEGAPDTPAWDRWWQIIEQYKVNILYCAPTAIRAFMKQGDQWPGGHDLSSLRLLGSVGEPINPEAWLWYQRNIGAGLLDRVDHPCPGRDGRVKPTHLFDKGFGIGRSVTDFAIGEPIGTPFDQRRGLVIEIG
jgi:hypothetical protein